MCLNAALLDALFCAHLPVPEDAGFPSPSRFKKVLKSCTMFPGTFVFPLYLTKRHVYGKQSETRWLVKLEIKLTPLTSGPRGKEQRAERG